MLSRAIRTLSGILLLTGTVGPLTACGNPRYTYVKNSNEKTYFKVPADWHQIEQESLDRIMNGDPDSASAQALKKVGWSVAFDADDRPSTNHLNLLGGDQPTVLAFVRPLTEEEQSVISLNHLRDVVHPVTTSAREEAAQTGELLPDFELLRDEVLKPGSGLRGVRETYNYSTGLGALQTFDKTVYLSDDGHIYVLLIRCSAHCYHERSNELDSIARSFTVRKNP